MRRQAPPTSNIRNAISAVREQLEQFLRDRGRVGAEPAATAADAAKAALAAGHAHSANGVGHPGPREDAFSTLMQVADFFRRTEPQSPIPYLLEQAVRWGKMPLPELLNEMLPADRSHAVVQTRGNPPAGEESVPFFYSTEIQIDA